MTTVDDVARVLCSLYGDDPRSRWMLQRAELDLDITSSNAETIERWRTVVVAALLRGRLTKLLAEATTDFPDQPDLRCIIEGLERRRRRKLWTRRIGLLAASAVGTFVVGLLLLAPGTGRVHGQVMGLDPDAIMRSEIDLEGCLRSVPLSAGGRFTLSCPSLREDVSHGLSVILPNRTLEARLPPGRPGTGPLLVVRSLDPVTLQAPQLHR